MRITMRILPALILFLFPLTGYAADIWVDTIVDDIDYSNGSCTLREAIKSANTNSSWDNCEVGSGTDTIYFSVTGTISLIEALPTITGAVQIVGPGRDLLLINGGFFGSVLNFDVVNADSELSGVTLYGGAADIGGGIRASGLSGSLAIRDCNINDNFATDRGAGIHSTVDLVLQRVNVLDNTNTGISPGSNGGGLYLSGGPSLLVEDSSISGNSAVLSGGGIFASLSESLTITRSTLSSNTAGGLGGGIYFRGSGLDQTVTITHNNVYSNQSANAGIHLLCFSQNQNITLRNNILALNTETTSGDERDIINFVEPACTQSIDSTRNLIGAANNNAVLWPVGNPNVNGDYVGDITSPIVVNVGTLELNGRATTHHALLPTSLNLIDAGLCPGETRDQVGATSDLDSPDREVDIAGVPNADEGCDIGPIEYRAVSQRHKLDVKVFLDGAYVDGTNSMTSDLESAGLIPANHPFNVAPWTHSGGEFLTPVPAGTSDWVLVRIWRGGRLDAGGLVEVDTRAYGVDINGKLFNSTGSGYFNFDPGNYFVSIEQRNHLGVMSRIPIEIEWDGSAIYDFTSALDAAFSSGGIAMRDRSGVFTMWAGDGNASEDVTSLDFLNVWLSANGSPPGYLMGDFDLSSDVTSFDFLNAWLASNGQARQW